MTVVQNIACMYAAPHFAFKRETVYDNLPTSNEVADHATCKTKHVWGVYT